MPSEQFLQLINELLSSENTIRKDAEAKYESLLEENSVWVMYNLSELCATVETPAVAQMSIVLLKKIFSLKSECFNVADAASQATVKAYMLQMLGVAAFGKQSNLAAICVSALVVKMYSMQQHWDELWNSVFQTLENVDSPYQLKAMCCKIIATTASSLAVYFEGQSSRIVSGIKNCLHDSSIEAREGAFDVFINVGACKPLPELKELVPIMLNVLQQYLNASSWEEAEGLTSKLAEAVMRSSKLFDGHAGALLQGLMDVASRPSVAKGVRHMAIETLVTYCESEPKTVRSVPNFSTSFMELLFQYTLEPEIPENWDTTGVEEEEDDNDEAKDSDVGSESIDRLVSALGGRKLEALCQQLFLSNIQSPDWKQRNAALLLITHASEGMAPVLNKHIGDIIKVVVAAFRDETKYVRASALECITQISSVFVPTIQKDFSYLVLPEIIQCLKDDVPAIATRAARCAEFFFDSFEADDSSDDEAIEIFRPYVEGLCVSLVTLMGQTMHQFVRNDCLGALSSIIITCKDAIKPFVHNLVPVFQGVLAAPDDSKTMPMKCKGIECITLLAASAGKEEFAPYSNDVCNYLNQLLDFIVNNGREDDMRLRYVLRGWSCMVECLQGDAVPYLQFVIPVILKMMNVNCDAEMMDADVEEEEEGDDDKVETMRFAVPGVGIKKFKMHTALIEEKELAANIITLMVTYVGKELGPHMHNIMTSAVDLLEFKSNPSIREAGALILDGVLCACEPNEAATVSLSVLQPLLDQFREEDDLDASSAISVAISRCLDSTPEFVNPEIVKSISDTVLLALQRGVANRAEILQKRFWETDEDELDALETEEDEANKLICDSCDLLEKMLERAGAVFAPLFLTTFTPILEGMLNAEEKDILVSRGLMFLCSLLEHAPDHAANLIPRIAHSAIAFAQSRSDLELLQAAYYLMNLLLQHFVRHPDALVQGFVGKVFETLSQHSVAQNDEEHHSAICNAVSTAVTMLSSFYEMLSVEHVQQTLDYVINCLPVKGDETEACRVHECVLNWVLAAHPVLQGRDGHVHEITKRLKTADREMLSSVTMEHLSRI